MNKAMDHHGKYSERIDALSAAQRDRLASRLGVPALQKRLIAFYIPQQDAEGSNTDPNLHAGEGADEFDAAGVLREFAAASLPDYMVPTSFIAVDRLPHLPNGKIDSHELQRIAANHRDQTRAGSGFVPPRNDVERRLAAVWAAAMNMEPGEISVHDNFFEIGGDSITSIHIVSRARRAGIAIEPRDILDKPTIAQLANAARESQGADPAEPPDTTVSGEVPLSPIQHWFLELNLPKPHHWNQAVLCELAPDLDQSALRAAVNAWIGHHDMLRAGIKPADDGTGWTQWIPVHANSGVAGGSTGSDAIPTVDCSGLDDTERDERIRRELGVLHAGLKLDGTPLMRLMLFDSGPGNPGHLAIILHHLVTDALSWSVLLEDLATVYRLEVQPTETRLPPRSASYQRWSTELTRLTQSGHFDRELDFWLTASPADLLPLPLNSAESASAVEGNTRTLVTIIDEDATEALSRANAAYRTHTEDLLLTALGRAATAWAESTTGSLRIGLERHGRDHQIAGLDVARTVGWFTAYFPLTIPCRLDEAPGQSIKRVKELIRAVPNNGRGFGALRFLSKDPDVRLRLKNLPAEQLLFNYLGAGLASDADRKGPLRSIRHEPGNARALENRRPHPIEVNAIARSGRLEIIWTYAEKAVTAGSLSTLASLFTDECRALIDHCSAKDSAGFTPSDFPEANLDQDTLDKLMDNLT